MTAQTETRNPRWEVWCDRAVISGVLFLTAFTPFAFGAVHPWAYTIMEAVIFILVIGWMIKIALLTQKQSAKERAGSAEPGAGSVGATGWSPDTSREEQSAMSEGQRSERFAVYALPLALFLSFVLFQLLPLPPRALRVLSPQTFHYYTQALPGWPGGSPDVGRMERGAWSPEQRGSQVHGEGRKEQEAKSKELTQENGEAGKKDHRRALSNSEIPKSNLHAPRSRLYALSSLLRASGSLLPHNWLPLSLAPALTRADILKFTAYVALFLLILLYPFRPRISKSEIEDRKLSDASSSIGGSGLMNSSSGNGRACV